MFGWLGKLFGSDKAASSLIDNISSGLDKIWYTDQEKAEDLQKAKSEANQVYMQWLSATSGSNLARRFIAIIVTLVWSAQYAGSLLMASIAPWFEDPKTVEAMMKTSDVLASNGEQGNGAFMVILGFYFLGNKADALFQAAVDKFTKPKSQK